MAVVAHVPEYTGTDKDGSQFTYGGYDVTLETCPKDGNLFSDVQQHAQTPAHKAASQ